MTKNNEEKKDEILYEECKLFLEFCDNDFNIIIQEAKAVVFADDEVIINIKHCLSHTAHFSKLYTKNLFGFKKPNKIEIDNLMRFLVNNKVYMTVYNFDKLRELFTALHGKDVALNILQNSNIQLSENTNVHTEASYLSSGIAALIDSLQRVSISSLNGLILHLQSRMKKTINGYVLSEKTMNKWLERTKLDYTQLRNDKISITEALKYLRVIKRDKS